jgi:acetyl-CoA carboxylase carboxyl transferase subunit alpha
MLQYATYSVISPEGCASILWRAADKATAAAEAMGITAERLSQLGLVDVVVPEPLGGAHRDVDDIARRLKVLLVEELDRLEALSPSELLEARYARLMQHGKFQES